MNWRILLMAAAFFVSGVQNAVKAQTDASASQRLTLQEAVELALKHNHSVRISTYQVEQKRDSKDVARSSYFPSLRTEGQVLRVTDSQFIQLPEGSLGTVAGTPIPQQPVTLNQGGHTFVISGTTLAQPLTQILTRIKPANDIAVADLDAARANALTTQNKVALKVHQLYYQVLIAQLHRSATEAKIRAAEDLQNERVEQVKYGSVLEEQLIDSRAQALEAKQDLLTTELHLSDLTMALDDAIGLPLTTQLTLDSTVPGVREICAIEECLQVTLKSHPEIAVARAELEKASSAVRLAKADYIPDVSAFARYNYQDNVPFLARNFGTFGLQVSYDLFDGGRRRAKVRESDAQVAQANENLARVTEEVELSVQTAYNKLQRTKQMVQVSQQVLALREESTRLSAQQLQHGTALKSEAEGTAARELDAKTTLLQSQLDYIAAGDELIEAMGQTPR